MALTLGGCNTTKNRLATLPTVGALTNVSVALKQMAPPPEGPLTVAVYDFPDLTGQRKSTPNATVADLSTAVTQGASSLVIEALRSAGNGTLFRVVDRTRDADQARERQVLENSLAQQARGFAVDTRNAAAGKRSVAVEDRSLKGLVPASYIINGGVVAFEKSVETGGATASFLGMGGGVNNNRSSVSVTMRFVRSDTAEVVESVTVHKAIDENRAGIFSRSRVVNGLYPESLLQKYHSTSDYFEADISFSRAELVEIALREAIEAAVYELICRGLERGLWNLQTAPGAKQFVAEARAAAAAGPRGPRATSNAAPANEPPAKPASANAPVGLAAAPTPATAPSSSPLAASAPEPKNSSKPITTASVPMNLLPSLR